MKKDKKIITNKRRSFIKKAGLLTLGAAGVTTIKAPYAYSASNPIKWRLQTYSGAPLGAHVIKPQIEAFNKAAYGEMGLRAFSWVSPRRGSLFHIKAITVDGNMAYIGSANLSRNAMENSAEWGIVSYSPDLCSDLEEYIEKLTQDGRFSEV